MKIQYQLGNTISLALVLSSFLVTSTYANSKPVWNEISQAHSQNNQTGTIVEIAANNPKFKTLVAAIKAAGLEQTLSGKRPFTVFCTNRCSFCSFAKRYFRKSAKTRKQKNLAKNPYLSCFKRRR